MVYKLYGVKTEAAKARADEEFAIMHDAIKAEMMIRSRNIRDLSSTPAMLKRTLVACGVQIFGQFTGINGITRIGSWNDSDLEFDDSDQLLWTEDV